MMSGVMSLLHVAYVFRCHICHRCLNSYAYSDGDICGTSISTCQGSCAFRQSFFSFRPMFPITWMNVVIVFVASSVQINLQVFNHVSRCTAEGILSAPWLKPLHTPFIEVSFQMEAIVSDIHMIERECSVLVFFFFLSFSFLCRLTILTILMYIVA